MNPVVQFFVKNYALLCIGIAMIFMSIQNVKVHKKESFYTLCIIIETMILSALLYVERYGKDNGMPLLATWCSFFGYTLRPICILFFIRLVDQGVKRPHFIFIVPIILNFIVYSFSLFTNVPELSHLVFYYAFDENGVVEFYRGYSLLNFFSHFISALYMGYLIYLSIKKLKGKHISNAISILICAFFVVIAVTAESIFSNKDIQLLNITIAVTALFYYLFLYSERSKCDPLTGLFNRETYYSDLNKMNKSINGAIQLDMNGLKWINDNKGHQAGDEALVTIGRICEKNAKRNIYAYRLGGDEFTILTVNSSEDKIKMIINQIKSDLENNSFSHYLLYLIDDKIVGYINYYLIYERIEIANFNVLDDYQDKHIGTSLINELISKYEGIVDNITLEVKSDNIKAIHIYEKMGFKKVARRENYYNGIDGVLMERGMK